jgi:hypothetical protein
MTTDTVQAQTITRWPHSGERITGAMFEGQRIARMTDYFGQAFPAPAWRAQRVDRDDA